MVVTLRLIVRQRKTKSRLTHHFNGREISFSKLMESNPMPRAAIRAVRDVTLLMMVRQMPEGDFNSLCDSILATDAGLSGFDPSCGRSRQILADSGSFCDACGEPVEASPLTEAVTEHTGAVACRACIDTALGLIFGAEPGDGDRGVMGLAAAIIVSGRKPQAAGRRPSK